MGPSLEPPSRLELTWASDDTLYYSSAESPKIFLAEDDDDLRDVLIEEMSRRGYEVVAASNGESLAVLMENDPVFLLGVRPITVVSDLRMSGRSGLDLLQHLRACGWRTPVMLITAFANSEIRDELDRLSPAYLLEKPFDLDVFMNAIDQLVGI